MFEGGGGRSQVFDGNNRQMDRFALTNEILRSGSHDFLVFAAVHDGDAQNRRSFVEIGEKNNGRRDRQGTGDGEKNETAHRFSRPSLERDAKNGYRFFAQIPLKLIKT